MSAETKRRWKAIVHGNEQYPFPLSIHTDDSTEWVARDGCVSRREYIHLIAAAPAMYEALEEVHDFIRFGIELGYIRMPDADLTDAAHDVPEKVRAALALARGED